MDEKTYLINAFFISERMGLTFAKEVGINNCEIQLGSNYGINIISDKISQFMKNRFDNLRSLGMVLGEAKEIGSITIVNNSKLIN